MFVRVFRYTLKYRKMFQKRIMYFSASVPYGTTSLLKVVLMEVLFVLNELEQCVYTVHSTKNALFIKLGKV